MPIWRHCNGQSKRSELYAICSGQEKENMTEFNKLLAQRGEEVVGSVCIYLSLYHAT